MLRRTAGSTLNREVISEQWNLSIPDSALIREVISEQWNLSIPGSALNREVISEQWNLSIPGSANSIPERGLSLIRPSADTAGSQLSPPLHLVIQWRREEIVK